MIKNVGQSYLVNNNLKKFCYGDVVYDKNKWANANLFLPSEFDLCELKTKNRVYKGWINCNVWDGLKINSNAQVLFWRKIKE